jgi:methionyl-tRNA formyltransferase
MRRMKVVFMGSPDFALPSLEALVARDRFAPRLVVSQPDRPRGRGRRVVPTPIRARALEAGIPTEVMTRKTYKAGVERIAALEPDVVIVVAFGIILKRDLLELPAMGCVNVHASLLPRHRGVSPIQAAILAGDDVTGCTTMRIDEGIDTGDVLLKETTPIRPDDTAGTLSERLANLGAPLLVRTLEGLADGSVRPRPQGESGATYTRKITKDDGAIDWTRPAVDVERRVRAMTPWPSAHTRAPARAGSSRLIIIEAALARGSAHPGTVLSLRPLTVACGDGALELRRVKPEGRGVMDAAAYLSGHALEAGDRFGGGDE